MTKKDYELIAKALKDRRETLKYESQFDCDIIDEKITEAQINELDLVISALASNFQNGNPRFNRAKFLQACGYND